MVDHIVQQRRALPRLQSGDDGHPVVRPLPCRCRPTFLAFSRPTCAAALGMSVPGDPVRDHLWRRAATHPGDGTRPGGRGACGTGLVASLFAGCCGHMAILSPFSLVETASLAAAPVVELFFFLPVRAPARFLRECPPSWDGARVTWRVRVLRTVHGHYSLVVSLLSCDSFRSAPRCARAFCPSPLPRIACCAVFMDWLAARPCSACLRGS